MPTRLWLSVVCVLAIAASAAGAQNLIRNAGFEKIDDEGYLSDFSRTPTFSAGLDAALNVFEPSGDAHSGLYSAKLTLRRGGFVSQRNLQLEAGKPYRFSFWVKTDIDPVRPSKYTTGAMISLYPTLPPGWGGSWPKVAPRLIAGAGRQRWRKLETYFRADKKWNNLWLAIYVSGAAGTAWFDDLELVECSEAELARYEASKGAKALDCAENLLPNGSFEITTNTDWPDFLRTGIGAAWSDSPWPWKESYRIMHDDPPHGRNYLRARSAASFQDVGIDPGAKDFVVSFFARSQPGPSKVSVGFVEYKTIQVGPQWRRYVVRMENRRKKKRAGFRVALKSKAKGHLDLDAVKVQYGSHPAPYSPNAYDRYRWDALAALARPALVEGAPTLKCPAVRGAPEIDGRVDEREWKRAAATGPFHLSDGSRPTQECRAYVMRDAENLYVAFVAAEEHMKSLLMREARPDRLSHLDDSVGVTIQPWPERRNSLAKRFVVSAAGVKSEGRGLRWWWDAPWRARVSHARGGWSAEMAIPLAALCEGTKPADTWGINFFRHRPGSGPRRTENSFRAGSKAEELSPFEIKLPKILTSRAIRIGAPRLFYESPDAKKATCLARLAGPAGAAKTLEWRFESKTAGAPLICKGAVSSDGSTVKFASIPVEALAAVKDGFIAAREPGEGLRAFRYLPEIRLPRLIELSPPRWNYTFSGEPNSVRARIGVAAEATKDLRVEFVLSRDGKVLVSKTVSAEKAAAGFALDQKLDAGDYLLSASLVDGSGKKQKAERTFPFRKLAGKAISVRIDQWRRMLTVDGGPFIPYVFSISHAWTHLKRFAEVKRAGFNTLFIWGTEGWSPKKNAPKVDHEHMRRVLDEAKRLGLRVILSPRTKFSKPVTEMTLDEIIALHTSWEKLFADHDALLMWHHMDEIYAYWGKGKHKKKESDLVTLYRRCVAADPYRPHFNNSAYVGRIYGGPDSTDIISCTSYTINGLDGAAGTVNFAHGHKRAMDRDRRPHLASIWLQFYLREQREPTPAEMNAMVYGCLVHDTRQLMFWTMRCNSNELWRATSKLAAEIKQLAPVLYNAKRIEDLRVTHPGIVAAAFRDGEKLYVLAANLELVPVEARFDLGAYEFADGKVEVMFDRRTVKADGPATFADRIESHGRRAFVIRLK